MTPSLKARLQAGQICLNGWSLLPSPYVVEVYGQAGWDSVTIDMQHGMHDYASMLASIHALQPFGVPALVRVPWNAPGDLGRILDAGAKGVICPMVNNAAEAAALAAACLYPPHGQRSNGPVRGADYGAASPYQARANEEVLILPQIETAEAVSNVEEILDTPGIGGIYIGPSDLGLSHGLPAIMDRDEPEMLAIYEVLLKATLDRGLAPAIHCTSPAYAARMAAMGFRLVTVGTDTGAVMRASREAVSTVRKTLLAG